MRAVSLEPRWIALVRHRDPKQLLTLTDVRPWGRLALVASCQRPQPFMMPCMRRREKATCTGERSREQIRAISAGKNWGRGCTTATSDVFPGGPAYRMRLEPPRRVAAIREFLGSSQGLASRLRGSAASHGPFETQTCTGDKERVGSRSSYGWLIGISVISALLNLWRACCEGISSPRMPSGSLRPLQPRRFWTCISDVRPRNLSLQECLCWEARTPENLKAPRFSSFSTSLRLEAPSTSILTCPLATHFLVPLADAPWLGNEDR
jgi:hypothetical protein